MSENKQQDENVLNPERKDESDLTRREKRLLEKEKLKGMGVRKKLEYIWMYYKPAIFGVILFIAAIFVGMDLYENAKKETILSIAVVNSGDFDSEAMELDIKKMLGAEDPYDQVEIGVNLMTDEDGKAFDYYTQMAYVTQLQTQSIDVMVMPESIYETLAETDVFADLKEVLEDDVYQSFGDNIDTNHLILDGSQLKADMGLSYEPVCAAVMVNAKHPDEAGKWIASLAK